MPLFASFSPPAPLAWLRSCTANGAGEFLVALQDFLETTNPLIAAPSGREALGYLLDSLSRRQPGRKKVLLCSFNCPLVGRTVLERNLELDPYDLASPTGGIDCRAVGRRLSRAHLALLVTHPFGVPVDFRPLIAECRRQGTVLIEDCAHTVGGRIGGQMAGTLGDAAIFSFNRDKPLALGGGGALLLNARQLHPEKEPDFGNQAWAEEAGALRFFLRLLEEDGHLPGDSRLHRTLSLRLADLCAKPSNLAFRGLHPLRAAYGLRLLAGYGERLAQRNSQAKEIASRWPAHSWTVSPFVSPAWFRQRLVASDCNTLEQLRQAALAHGFTATNTTWPSPVGCRTRKTSPPANAAHCALHGIDLPLASTTSLKDLAGTLPAPY